MIYRQAGHLLIIHLTAMLGFSLKSSNLMPTLRLPIIHRLYPLVPGQRRCRLIQVPHPTTPSFSALICQVNFPALKTSNQAPRLALFVARCTQWQVTGLLRDLAARMKLRYCSPILYSTTLLDPLSFERSSLRHYCQLLFKLAVARNKQSVLV